MDDDPLIGSVVAEHFLVLEMLGAGGMGRVYRAEQLELGREVALKTLLLAHTVDAATRRERFHREARAASRINHPHVVQTYAFGEWEGQLYIAMELIDGQSLAQEVLRSGPIAGARAARLLIQTCEAVQAAHDVGVLHRDIKPENIMLTGTGEHDEWVKVVDFGLAIVMAATDERLTQEGLVMGTPAYVSPEQARAELLDERSDVYSLGVVLFELLCGRPPFTGRNPADVVVKHCFEEPPTPSSLAPQLAIHPSLESAALWALSKAPEARPPTAQAFADELRAALDLVERNVHDPLRSRKAPLPAGGRLARGMALGLDQAAAQAPTQLQGGAEVGLVLVCETRGEAFASSLTACLRAQGHTVEIVEDLTNLRTRAQASGASIAVVDLRSDPMQILDALADDANGLTLTELGVIAVGPDDAMPLMTRALELGVGDFVPASLVNSKLGARVSKLARRRRRKS